MDQESFETHTLNSDMVGNALELLVEGAIIQLHKFNGNPIGLQLPEKVELEVDLHRARRARRHQRQRDQTGPAPDRPGDQGSALYSRWAKR